MTDTTKLEEFKADLRALLEKYECELHIHETAIRGTYHNSILFECGNWTNAFEYDAGTWVDKNTV